MVALKSYKFDERSQDVSLLHGMPIIASINKKDLSIMNNEMFKITKADAEFKTITSSENESMACMSIKTSEFTKLFNIGFCITIHCRQGQSYDHPYSIYEWEMLRGLEPHPLWEGWLLLFSGYMLLRIPSPRPGALGIASLAA